MSFFKSFIGYRVLSIKRALYLKLRRIILNFKQPKMLWGYKNPNGLWQERTRVSDTIFMYHPERIVISDNVFIWHYTIIDGTGGVEIGDGCQIGAWVGIFTHSSHIAIRIYGNHYQEIPECKKQGYPINNIKIGKYVFIGAGSKILPGVSIGDGALVTAGTIVNKTIAPFQIVSGNPAKVIGDTRELDQKYLEDSQLKKWYYEWQKK